MSRTRESMQDPSSDQAPEAPGHATPPHVALARAARNLAAGEHPRPDVRLARLRHGADGRGAAAIFAAVPVGPPRKRSTTTEQTTAPGTSIGSRADNLAAPKRLRSRRWRWSRRDEIDLVLPAIAEFIPPVRHRARVILITHSRAMRCAPFVSARRFPPIAA